LKISRTYNTDRVNEIYRPIRARRKPIYWWDKYYNNILTWKYNSLFVVFATHNVWIKIRTIMKTINIIQWGFIVFIHIFAINSCTIYLYQVQIKCAFFFPIFLFLIFYLFFYLCSSSVHCSGRVQRHRFYYHWIELIVEHCVNIVLIGNSITSVFNELNFRNLDNMWRWNLYKKIK